MLKYPEFKNKKEMFKYIIENKDMLVSQKMMSFKKADAFGYSTSVLLPNLKIPTGKSFLTKLEVGGGVEDTGLLEVKSIINTTNYMDSHDDVHIKGLWDASLRKDSDLMHLQEHRMMFDKIIADQDDVSVATKDYTWKELGFNYEGTTQALEFVSNVRKSRNEYMYKQYKDGNVNNHSVGMRYGKLDIAIDDEDYPVNKALFDEHIDSIANKEYAEERGMFWAIMEASAIEGSAVPKGSNSLTPTASVRSKYYSLGVKKNITTETKEIKALKAFLNITQ